MWFTSDHHFNHKNIMLPEYEDRPFDTMSAMHSGMINEWNQHIKDTHAVWYLGDFCLGEFPKDYRYALSCLNADTITWLKGNHDVSIAKLNTLPRVTAMKWAIIPIHDIGNVILSHKPVYDYDKDNIDLCIHGHIHTRDGRDVIYKRDDRIFFHVGVDANGFKPWHVDNVARIYKRFRRKHS